MAENHTVPGPGVPARRNQRPCGVTTEVVPIIFIPGIAGSNLKIKEDSKETVKKRLGITNNDEVPHPWRPPTGIVESVMAVRQWSEYSGTHRQILLNSATTEADNEGFLTLEPGQDPLERHHPNGEKFRGWHSIYKKPYWGLLNTLENTFNSPFYDSNMLVVNEGNFNFLSAELKDISDTGWGRFSGMYLEQNRLFDFRVPFSSIQKALKISMPVFAFGYNWLQSNKTSAGLLIERINEIIKILNIPDTSKGIGPYKCKQVILITHSMGGLVARSAIAQGCEKQILGVIHGVMPSIGTPETYKTMVAGNEPRLLAAPVIPYKYRNGAAVIMGDSHDKTTPVMGNSRGCLELLPNKEYPTGWLSVVQRLPGSSNFEEILCLPNENPYSEIYKNTTAWYRLIESIHLDPAKIVTTYEKNALTGFMENIDLVENFHDELKNTIFSDSFAFYGKDPSIKTRSKIYWCYTLGSDKLKLSETIAKQARLITTSHGGIKRNIGIIKSTDQKNYRNSFQLQILEPDAGGDQTVAWPSGVALKAKYLNGKIWGLNKITHQDAMKSTPSKVIALGGIIKFIEKYEICT